MKRKKKFIKVLGLLLAAAGTVVVIQLTPLYIWYALLAALCVLLAAVIFMR